MKPENYNKAWWNAEEYQGIAPPVERTEADFDRGEVSRAGNVPTRGIFGRILQFQFQGALP